VIDHRRNTRKIFYSVDALNQALLDPDFSDYDSERVALLDNNFNGDGTGMMKFVDVPVVFFIELKHGQTEMNTESHGLITPDDFVKEVLQSMNNTYSSNSRQFNQFGVSTIRFFGSPMYKYNGQPGLCVLQSPDLPMNIVGNGAPAGGIYVLDKIQDFASNNRCVNIAVLDFWHFERNGFCYSSIASMNYKSGNKVFSHEVGHILCLWHTWGTIGRPADQSLWSWWKYYHIGPDYGLQFPQGNCTNDTPPEPGQPADYDSPNNAVFFDNGIGDWVWNKTGSFGGDDQYEYSDYHPMISNVMGYFRISLIHPDWWKHFTFHQLLIISEVWHQRSPNFLPPQKQTRTISPESAVFINNGTTITWPKTPTCEAGYLFFPTVFNIYVNGILAVSVPVTTYAVSTYEHTIAGEDLSGDTIVVVGESSGEWVYRYDGSGSWWNYTEEFDDITEWDGLDGICSYWDNPANRGYAAEWINGYVQVPWPNI
jgi:hypothetical protein